MGLAHGRVSIEGTLSSGAESWSTGFSVGDISGLTIGVLEDFASAVALAWVNDVFDGGAAGNLWAPETVTERVKVQDINAAGVVLRTVTANDSLPLGGASTAEQLPPEVAEVVSLRTSLSGARYRGRMYLPAVAANQVTLDGYMAGACQTDIADAMQAFVNSVQASGFTPVVYSAAAPALTVINKIMVGHVFDAQRRRRNVLVEDYTSRIV